MTIISMTGKSSEVKERNGHSYDKNQSFNIDIVISLTNIIDH